MTDTRYLGACDASAAIHIAGSRLFAAASDEDCILRIYDLDDSGPPVSETDVTAFLEPDDPDQTEADIEGAAQVLDRIYWIGSHGRSRGGHVRKIRQRLFATTLDRQGAGFRVRPHGRPYKELLADLISAPGLASFDLATASTKRPEEPGGLNIEGLAPTTEGHLLIGFRNPIPNGLALMVRLRNPAVLFDGRTGRAEIDLAATLDLQGLGIRALEFVPELGVHLVLAGAFNDEDRFRLYLWSGPQSTLAQPIDVDLAGLKPEELIVEDAEARGLSLRLLSDDGTDECKAAPAGARHFRGRMVQVTV